jgi:hypothetical protein
MEFPLALLRGGVVSLRLRIKSLSHGREQIKDHKDRDRCLCTYCIHSINSYEPVRGTAVTSLYITIL